MLNKLDWAVLIAAVVLFFALLGYVIRDLNRICRSENWDGTNE